MKSNVYIQAASCISPQQTFASGTLPDEPVYAYAGKINAVEPDYKVHLNIPAARRMSRLIKMGVCAALKCLQDADVKVPDAIISGTGLGCMEDSEKFLASLIVNHEQTLSPTSFIFSTHNTVAAQIALLLQCNNYNFTHTHRGLSFENSLLDAILFLKDHPDAGVLAGATDEVTATSLKILDRLGLIRDGSAPSLFEGESKGTVAGEGAAFFFLGNSRNDNSLCELKALDVASHLSGEEEIASWVEKFANAYEITKDDFILTGRNGDAKGDAIYSYVLGKHFHANPSGNFKHLCGEYHTATAFACWLSAMMLKSGNFPDYIFENNQKLNSFRRILVFNHYKGRECALMLLEKC